MGGGGTTNRTGMFLHILALFPEARWAALPLKLQPDVITVESTYFSKTHPSSHLGSTDKNHFSLMLPAHTHTAAPDPFRSCLALAISSLLVLSFAKLPAGGLQQPHPHCSFKWGCRIISHKQNGVRRRRRRVWDAETRTSRNVVTGALWI